MRDQGTEIAAADTQDRLGGSGEAAAPAGHTKSRVAPPKAPIRSGAAAKPLAKDRLLRGLRASAKAGDECPTNYEFAAYLGPTVSNTLAGNLLRELERDGEIVIRMRGKFRVVSAADGSWSTAEPEALVTTGTRADVRNAVLALVRRGVAVNEAARMSGIPADTIRAWRDGVQVRGAW